MEPRSSSGAGGGATFGTGRGGGNAEGRGPVGPGVALSRLDMVYEPAPPPTCFELLMLPPPDDSMLLMLGASEVDMVEILLDRRGGIPPV
jgi:hypothetical protein